MTFRNSLPIVACAVLFLPSEGDTMRRAEPQETVIIESQIDIGTSSGGMWFADGFAYVARFGDSGVSIIDVRDPVNPQIASVYSTAATEGTWDVKAAEGYAYLSPQYSGYGLVILDVSDPYSPQLVTNWTHARVGSVHNLWIDTARQTLYLASNTTGDVEVVDVSDPYNPQWIGSFGSASGFIHDVITVGDVLYASFLDGGLYLGNLSVSPVPTLLGFVDYPSAFTHNAWPTADGNYVLTTDEYTGASVKIWDVTNPSQIVQVASYLKNPNAVPHNVFVRNRYAFIAYYTEGLVVLDISDPENPVEVGHYDTYPGGGGGFEGAWGAYPYDDYVYVSDIQSGLFTFSFKPVTLAVSEITSSVPRGGDFSYRATVLEWTGFPLGIMGRGNVYLPNGNGFTGNPVLGPVTVQIGPLGTLSGRISHHVPQNAPLGTYTYEARLEDAEGYRLDSVEFPFDIVPMSMQPAGR